MIALFRPAPKRAPLTRFQAISMWGLRAVAVWALVEGALFVSDRVSADASAWQAVAHHQDAVARLETKARRAEREHAALAKRSGQTEVKLTPATLAAPHDTVASMLGEIIDLAGGKDLIVKASFTDPDARVAVLECEASWREPAAIAGRSLEALQAYLPALPITDMSMVSIGSDVRTTIRFQLLARKS